MLKTPVYLFKDDPDRSWKGPEEYCREKEFLHVVQGEAGSEQLEFHLMQNASRPFDLTGQTVTFYLTKPDGEKIFLSADIPAENAAQGIAVATLTAQCTAAAGITKYGEVRVTQSDGGTLKFPAPDLFIAASDTGGALESTSEFQALDLALSQAETAFSSATAANEAAQEVLGTDRAAVSEAAQNAQAADQAAADATSAADAANAAAQTASENAQSADGAAQRANAAAAACETIAGDINEAADARIDAQKGAANGLASLDAQKKLAEMPTAADVGAVPVSDKGAAGGVATLDDASRVPEAQIQRTAARITPVLNSPFSFYVGLYYYKDLSGIVHLEGSIAKDTGTNTVITNLPGGYRPSGALVFMAYNWSNASVVRIVANSNGDIVCDSTDASIRIDIALSFLSQG